MFLKQSTAVTIQMGPALDKTDGVTEETGLTPTVELSKADAAFAARSSAGAIVHDANGWYRVPLDATDTGTLGRLIAKFDDAATHLPVWHEFTVLAANVYDSLVAATDDLDVQVSGIDANAITATAINADAIGASELATDAVDEIVDAVWDEAMAGHVGAGTAGEQLGTDVDAILADTNELQTDDVPGLIAALNDPAAAAIADAVWDELLSGHLTAGSFGERFQIIRNGQAQGGGATSITLDASASGSDDFYNNQIVAIIGGTGAGQSRIIEDYTGATKAATVAAWVTNPDATSDFIILPFGAIPGATAPTAAAVADAVWDEPAADHIGAGTEGNLQERLDIILAGGAGQLTGARAALLDNIDVAISALNDLSAAQVNAEVDAALDTAIPGVPTADSINERLKTLDDHDLVTKLPNILSLAAINAEADTALTDYDPPTNAELTTEINSVQTDIAALNDPTAAAIADAVLDEAIAGHVGAGSVGNLIERLDIIATGGAGALTNARAALLANLDAAISSRAAEAGGNVAAIKAVTDQFVFTAANKVDAALNAAADFPQAAADKVWNTAARTLTGIADGILAAAELNNIADALLKRDMSAISGEAARSPINALRFLRNKFNIAGGVLSVKKENDTDEAWNATVTQTAGDPVSEIDPA